MQTRVEKLLQIRKKAKLNQAAFAGTLGIKQAHYSALERGKRSVSTKILERLIEKHGVSAEWWYKEDDKYIANNNIIRPENVPFSAKNAQTEVYDFRDVLPEMLDDVIYTKLEYLNFFFVDIAYHLMTKVDVPNAHTKDLKRVKTHVNELNAKLKGDVFLNEKYPYTQLNLMEKVKLIKEMDRDIRTMLDMFWLVTSNIKSIQL